MSDSIEDQFIAAIIKSGLTPPDAIVADGELHKFTSDAEHDDQKGWYVLHGDAPIGGSFGCWRHNVKVPNWKPKGQKKYSAAEREEIKRRMAKIAEKTAAEKAETEASAAKRAERILSDATEAPANHPYLVRKGVQPHGLLINRAERPLVPVRDAEGTLHSIQYIAPDGDKQFLANGRKKGCFFVIGELGSVFCIAEGFATAASIHEATRAFSLLMESRWDSHGALFVIRFPC